MLTNISGFPEFLPKDQIAFNAAVQRIKTQFELYGFSPLDTPAVERVSTLLAKGNDKEIYGLHRLADEGGSKDKDLALRFDLTVPLARYVAQHYGQLTFPYRRYHIAPVWRGERPQAGRYRQFYQCDVDIIGDGDLPLIYDADALSVIYHALLALGLQRFVIKVNNRRLLTGLISSFGIPAAGIPDILRIIDKADKIPQDVLANELTQHGLVPEGVHAVRQLMGLRLTNPEWLSYLGTLCQNQEFEAGLQELTQLLTGLRGFGVQDEHIQIDPTLARGLTYYTGTVAETKLLDFPELGSICGGGRYANLADGFTNKALPGVGFSIGLSRLIPKLIESGLICTTQETPAQVLVTMQDSALLPYYQQIATHLRDAGIKTELYLANKPLSAQLKYAGKKGFPFALIANHQEQKTQCIIIRRLSDGTQHAVPFTQTISLLKQLGT